MSLSVPLSLYVHFPWCVRKCPYCDFNSHSLRQALPEDEYIQVLTENLALELAASGQRHIETIFMGGGTPSLVSPDAIAALLGTLKRSGRLREGAEITLEANPGATDEGHYAGYLEAGVNRLSLGVQSFNDQLLARIGRIHTAEQARHAIGMARLAGFERINLDLMYALPGQTLAQAGADIEQALAMGVEHLSVYQLTIEPNTEFAVRPPALPESEQAWEMQQQATRLLSDAGYRNYEVSAWTRGEPCFHNLNYWRFGDYLAIGAGAHGKLSQRQEAGVVEIQRYWNHRHPKDYLAARASGEFRGGQNRVPQEEIGFEYLMNALRLQEGFELPEFSLRTGRSTDQLLDNLAPLFKRGWLQQQGENVRATEIGSRFLDSLLLECMVN